MIVLSGKKIRNVILGMFAVFMVATISLNTKEKNKEYMNTVSLPVSNKVVVVDAGHGIPDERS